MSHIHTTEPQPAAEVSQRRKLKNVRWLPTRRAGIFTILFVLIILVVFFGLLAPGFFTYFSLINILTSTSVFLLVALGETLIMISGGIDLSVGSMVGLTGVVSGVLMSNYYLQHPGNDVRITLLGFAVALLAGITCGAFNGVVISFLKLNPLIVTLGTYGAYLGIADIITNGIPVDNFPPFLFAIGNNGFIIPYLVWITLAVIVFFGWLSSRTRFGRYVYAIGANKEAARRAGINLRWHTILLYGLGGLTCGLVGFLSTAHFETASPVAGSTDLLIAVAAVVIGGTPLSGGEGNIWGTVIGALIISVLQNGFVLLNISAFWQLIAVGFAVILAVYFDELQRQARLQAVKTN
jgi:ribose transport system permease protein